MKDGHKKFIIIVSVFLIISFLMAPLRAGYIQIGLVSGFKLSSIVGFVLIYILTLWFLKKDSRILKKTTILTAIILGTSILNLPIRIINFDDSLVSLLEYLIHLSAIAIAYISLNSGKSGGIIVTIIGSIICIWLSIWGYDLWVNKINFDSFNGRLEGNTNSAMSFQSANGDTISIEKFKGKIVIVDCWITHCGICFKSFPSVQKEYERYMTDTTVLLIGLHCRDENDNADSELPSTGEQILEKEGYTFPCYSISVDEEILKDLGVNSYPTVLIFNKDGKLIFRGNIEGIDNVIRKEKIACT
jgi:hypothetical protein